MSDPLKNAKCEICHGAWQGVNLQGETLKCYHCSDAAKQMKDEYARKQIERLDNEVTKLLDLNTRQSKTLVELAKLVQKMIHENASTGGG